MKWGTEQVQLAARQRPDVPAPRPHPHARCTSSAPSARRRRRRAGRARARPPLPGPRAGDRRAARGQDVAWLVDWFAARAHRRPTRCRVHPDPAARRRAAGRAPHEAETDRFTLLLLRRRPDRPLGRLRAGRARFRRRRRRASCFASPFRADHPRHRHLHRPALVELTPPPPPPLGPTPTRGDRRSFTFANERHLPRVEPHHARAIATGVAATQLLPKFDVEFGRRLLGLPLIALGAVLTVTSYRFWRRTRGRCGGASRAPAPRCRWCSRSGSEWWR